MGRSCGSSRFVFPLCLLLAHGEQAPGAVSETCLLQHSTARRERILQSSEDALALFDAHTINMTLMSEVASWKRLLREREAANQQVFAVAEEDTHSCPMNLGRFTSMDAMRTAGWNMSLSDTTFEGGGFQGWRGGFGAGSMGIRFHTSGRMVMKVRNAHDLEHRSNFVNVYLNDDLPIFRLGRSEKRDLCFFFKPGDLFYLVEVSGIINIEHLSVDCSQEALSDTRNFTCMSGAERYFSRLSDVLPQKSAQAFVTAQGDYDQFVHDVIAALKQRALGKGSLSHYLEQVATKELTQCEWAEFGSFSGETMRMMIERRTALGARVPMHGFDSFRGLPEKWRNATSGGDGFAQQYLDKGSFDRKGAPPFEDPSRVKWHIGWYQDTVTKFAEELAPESLCFLHMDADIYSSTSTVFKALEKKLTQNAYIVFDELIGYPEYKEHEMKALYEMLRRTGKSVKVIGYPGPIVEEQPGVLQDIIQRLGHECDELPQNAILQLQ